MSVDRAYCLAPHQWGPAESAAWAEWAREMALTHEQRRCPDCRLPVIWVPLADADESPDEPGLFDVEHW